MATTVITPEINTAFNKVQNLLAKKLQPGITIRGEFVANTNQSKDYLAFVNLRNVPGLPNESVSHTTGIELSALDDTEACVELIITEIKRRGLINSYIFI